MIYMSGVCKKELKRSMPPIKNFPGSVPNQEYGYEVGDAISVSLHSSSDRLGDVNDHNYVLRVHYEKLVLTRQEVEELMEIQYEENAYNACMKGNVPCQSLRDYGETGSAERRHVKLASCLIGWEVGRASCRCYSEQEGTG